MKKTRPNEPINQFLLDNNKKHPVSFHMPGHKYGRWLNRLNRRFSSHDITEIKGADNIKKPEGIIKQSREMIADVYGSKYSYYLTNGTTSGIHAVLRYAAMKNKSLIVSRDCHISAVNGAILFKVDISFIQTGSKDGIPYPAKVSDVKKAIEENPDACGVLITSPNYYGVAADIGEISKAAHEKGMFLAVDEAHGAHFRFSGLSHLSGIGGGADIVCHSFHKTLPVYNQGAVMHICSGLINKEQMTEAVNMLGTTSPSYPILASMERAAAHLNADGVESYAKLRKRIYKFIDSNRIETIANDDYTRLVIKTGINGFKAAGILHEEYGIDVEAADFSHVICIATPGNLRKDLIRLEKALLSFVNEANSPENPRMPVLPASKIALDSAHMMQTAEVPVDMAAGRICGTIIVSYPPGTPLLCPGEIIDGYVIDYIKKVINAGGSILGIKDGRIPVLEQT